MNIQRLLEWAKLKSPTIFVAVAALLAGVKYFFVNQALGGYGIPSQSVDVVVGVLGSLASVHSVGSVNAKAVAASAGINLPLWLEAPIAKFLADFKVKNGKVWLWISVGLCVVYAAVKYSLTIGWTLPKLLVDIVSTIAPFILSAHTTGILEVAGEGANQPETR